MGKVFRPTGMDALSFRLMKSRYADIIIENCALHSVKNITVPYFLLKFNSAGAYIHDLTKIIWQQSNNIEYAWLVVLTSASISTCEGREPRLPSTTRHSAVGTPQSEPAAGRATRCANSRSAPDAIVKCLKTLARYAITPSVTTNSASDHEEGRPPIE